MPGSAGLNRRSRSGKGRKGMLSHLAEPFSAGYRAPTSVSPQTAAGGSEAPLGLHAAPRRPRPGMRRPRLHWTMFACSLQSLGYTACACTRGLSLRVYTQLECDATCPSPLIALSLPGMPGEAVTECEPSRRQLHARLLIRFPFVSKLARCISQSHHPLLVFLISVPQPHVPL